MKHRVTKQLGAWMSRSLHASIASRCVACGDAGSELSLCARCRRESSIGASFHNHRVGTLVGTLSVHALGLYWTRSGLTPSPTALVLHRFKYARERRAGRALARMLAAHAARGLDLGGAVVVPVPLHARRLRSRGFNQAAWLARALSRSSAATLHPDALVRRHDDAPRPGRTARERRTVTAPVFLAARPPPPQRRLVLVDDVCTTGATLAAAAAALAAHGRPVDAAVVLLLADRGRCADTALTSEDT